MYGDASYSARWRATRRVASGYPSLWGRCACAQSGRLAWHLDSDGKWRLDSGIPCESSRCSSKRIQRQHGCSSRGIGAAAVGVVHQWRHHCLRNVETQSQTSCGVDVIAPRASNSVRWCETLRHSLVIVATGPELLRRVVQKPNTPAATRLFVQTAKFNRGRTHEQLHLIQAILMLHATLPSHKSHPMYPHVFSRHYP